MKKIRIMLMAVLMAMTLVFGLTACGSDSKDSSSSSSSKSSRKSYDDEDDEDESSSSSDSKDSSDDDDDDESSSKGSIFKNSSSKASSSNDSSSADGDESSSGDDDTPTPKPTKKPKNTPTPEPTEEPDDTPAPLEDNSAEVKTLVNAYIKKYVACDGGAIVDYYYSNLLDKLIKNEGMTRNDFDQLFTNQLKNVFDKFKAAGVDFKIIAGDVENIESLNKLKDVAKIKDLDSLKSKVKSEFSSNGAGSVFDKKKVTEAYAVGMTMEAKGAGGSNSKDGAIYVYKYDGKWMIFDKFLNS